MGIIIFPFLFGALLLSIFSIVRTFLLYRDVMIDFNDIVYGFAISVTIFILICISYFIEGKAWALSPAFRLPIFMVFLPFGFYLIAKTSSNTQINYYATLVLISVGISGILGMLFNDFFFGLLDFFGIEKHY